MIEESTKSVDIGSSFPQIYDIRKGYDEDSEFSIYNTICKSYNNFPVQNVDFSCLVLNKKSKLTDVLSTAYLGANGMLISNRLLGLLNDFICHHSKVYPVNKIQWKENDDIIDMYNWIHFIYKIEEIDSIVDIRECIVFDKKIDTKREVRFSSFKEYYVTKQTHNYTISKLVLNKNIPYDMFKCGLITNLIVSERLKNAIESNGVTGIKFSIL